MSQFKPDETHHLPVAGNLSHRLTQAKDRFEQKKQQLKAALNNGVTPAATKVNTRYQNISSSGFVSNQSTAASLAF